jgi:tripeptide aminopeptidase
VLSPAEFPHLNKYVGQDVVVTDGTTLLGADDKAGAAAILSAMEFLAAHPEIPHGKIRVAFTPDEEIGRGTDRFNVETFGADFAYTVDGGEQGELEAETFNAARAIFKITGKSVHPGTAKNVMRNAGIIAAEMVARFPENETPRSTAGREGFYHLTEISGETGFATFSYILRDFDAEGLDKRKRFCEALADEFNRKYENAAELTLRDEYRNMAEVLKDYPHITKLAREAMEAAGVAPIEKPVRGGTDGARLSFMGLPCPNIFTGGHNFHGPYEYLPVPSLEAAVRVVVNICRMAAERA